MAANLPTGLRSLTFSMEINVIARRRHRNAPGMTDYLFLISSVAKKI
jgi:hypothetical protein